MKAIDTLMSIDEIMLAGVNFDKPLRIWLMELLEKQAEKSSGEMIRWIRSHPLIEPDEYSPTQFYPFYQIELRELEGGSMR